MKNKDKNVIHNASTSTLGGRNALDNLEILNSLSDDERKYALKLYEDMSNGDDTSYKELLLEDYEEIPVSVEEFLHNPKYLGRGLTDDTGRFTVYPYWEETLQKIFPDPLKPSKYNTVALSGAIGLGKSFFASLIMCYELYRMLCLKDPYVHYKLQPIDKISFAVMNITLDAARGVGWDKLQQLLQSSEWFLQHGTVSGNTNIEWHPGKRIELICGSQSRHIIGRAVYNCFFDEISFQPNQEVAKQIEKAKTLVNTASARMQSRFMRGDKNPTILILASSKRTEQSYMEIFIQSRKARDSKTTYVVDEPQWVIRNDKITGEWFKVAVGNKFLASEVLPLGITDEEVKEARNRGFNIIDVPMGYYENFMEDIDIALTDIAGISTTSSSRYISGTRLAAIKTKDYVNPFTKEILEIGNSPQDEHQYYDYFDMSKISEDLMSKPLFIHMDMSISGDKTGIAGVWVIGKKPHQAGQPESKDLMYQAAFAVSIKAPKGFQVSFEKNRNFIRWLREQGFAVKVVSTDTFQSYDTGQALLNEGFKHEMISVDRTNSDRICVPYQFFKSAIYEKRLVLFENDLLIEEIIGLERDNNSGRIDHSPSGINSKDMSDAVCGALYSASKHAEEFAFDYGELIDSISSSNEPEIEFDKEQLTINFEDELKNAQLFTSQDDLPKAKDLDFGMGASFDIGSMYASDGVLVW